MAIYKIKNYHFECDKHGIFSVCDARIFISLVHSASANDKLKRIIHLLKSLLCDDGFPSERERMAKNKKMNK